MPTPLSYLSSSLDLNMPLLLLSGAPGLLLVPPSVPAAERITSEPAASTNVSNTQLWQRVVFSSELPSPLQHAEQGCSLSGGQLYHTDYINLIAPAQSNQKKKFFF